MPVVTEVIREISSRRESLEALSLDCCHVVGRTGAAWLAESVGPTLRRLALDATLFQDWTVLACFKNLVELRLQNTFVSDAAMRTFLSHMPALETLAVHQVSTITTAALEPLAATDRLHTLELSRCIGIDDDAVRGLARISSLRSVRLVHIDVSARALEDFVRDMGPRLLSLSVNAISAAHDFAPVPTTAGVLSTLLETVKTHCKNVQNIDFGASTAVAGSHWSVRPYTEALRHPAPAASTVMDEAPARPSGFRIRARRLSVQRPLSCFY
jgi:hypothetical protein